MELIGLSQLMRFAAALILVLALMGGLALVMRRLNTGQGLSPGQKKRLKIIEMMPVDAKRRLVLLSRDGKEHLVILGANSETVIESGIESPQDEPHAQTGHHEKA